MRGEHISLAEVASFRVAHRRGHTKAKSALQAGGGKGLKEGKGERRGSAKTVSTVGCGFGVALLLVGLVPFTVFQPSVMGRATGLPSLKTFASLTARTFEGQEVSAPSMVI